MTAPVWLISGIPGSGKTTVARLLAGRFERAVHIEGDLLQEWVVSGGVWPGDEPRDEASSQIGLNVRNQALLARSFAEAGFTTVVDYVILDPTTHLAHLQGLSVYYVVLAPGLQAAIARDKERPKSISHAARHGLPIAERFAFLEAEFERLRGPGLWLDTRDLDPEQSVDAILSCRDKALIQKRNQARKGP